MDYQFQRSPKKDNNIAALLIAFMGVIIFGVGLFWIGARLGSGSLFGSSDENGEDQNTTANIIRNDEVIVSTPMQEIENTATVSNSTQETTIDNTVEVVNTETTPEDEELPVDEESEEPTKDILTLSDPNNTAEIGALITELSPVGRFSRYWWDNLNETSSYEVSFLFYEDGAVKLGVIGDKEEGEGYVLFFDTPVPGLKSSSLKTFSGGVDSLFEVVTTAGESTITTILKYTDDGVEPIVMEGGNFASDKTELEAIADSFSTDDISLVVRSGSTLEVYYGPEEIDGADSMMNKDSYTYSGGKFVFSSTVKEILPVSEE